MPEFPCIAGLDGVGTKKGINQTGVLGQDISTLPQTDDSPNVAEFQAISVDRWLLFVALAVQAENLGKLDRNSEATSAIVNSIAEQRAYASLRAG